MNKTAKYLLIFLSILWSLSAFAQKVYTIDDVPNVHLQDRNAYVSDPEQKLLPQHLQRLNKQLRFFENSLAIQCATIVLPAIDQEPNEFAHDLFNKWGVGDKATDRGLVVLLVYGDGEGSKRDIYMATGYGLEGDLPDALLKMVQVDKMVPLLKEEKFGEGLMAGLDYIQELLQNPTSREAIIAEIERQEKKNRWLGFIIYTLVGVIVFLVIMVLKWWDADSMATPRQGPYSNSKKKIPDSAKNWYRPYFEITPLIENPLKMGCIGILFFYLLPFYFIGIWIMKIVLKRKITCSHCKSRGKMKKRNVRIVKKATKIEDGYKEHLFICKKCNHQHIQKRSYMTFFNYLWMLIGFLFSFEDGLFGGGGGSSGGGSSGSSGGSWGGGSSGGGGAGTSF